MPLSKANPKTAAAATAPVPATSAAQAHRADPAPGVGNPAPVDPALADLADPANPAVIGADRTAVALPDARSALTTAASP